MQKPFNIAIAGLGTVGGGTAKLLLQNAELLQERCGRRINIVSVLERNVKKKDELGLSTVKLANSVEELLATPDLDLVVELIGGSEGISRTLVEAALKVGKHVVTANKALIAHHGIALARLAEASGAVLAFEGAVCGGMPIIKCMREGLIANRFKSVAGIFNGTCNFILTSMGEEHKDFSDALAEAQRIGYAEADPSFDVDGIDSAHKLAIVTSLAYGTIPDIDAVYVEGIRNIEVIDIEFADELGYTIKLLGIASDAGEGILQRVHPCMVSKLSPIGRVNGVYNGIVAEGGAVGDITMEGKGAGEFPTASSVVGDIADIARGARYKPFTIPAASLKKLPPASMADLKTAYYLRLDVVDRPGVLAGITGIFRDEGISVGYMLQHTRKQGEVAPVIIITHETLERSMQNALKSIALLDTVAKQPRMIRIENL